jgi:hypothetical protein
MNKLLTALILSATALTAQAGDSTNISCDITYENGKQKTFQAELLLDPKVMSGQIDGRKISIANFGDRYTIDELRHEGYHFALNRSTLEITDGIQFEGFAFFPDKYVGKCAIAQSNNKI